MCICSYASLPPLCRCRDGSGEIDKGEFEVHTLPLLVSCRAWLLHVAVLRAVEDGVLCS
jgi:hypothetical protein